MICFLLQGSKENNDKKKEKTPEKASDSVTVDGMYTTTCI
jgi:hypothetical protein